MRISYRILLLIALLSCVSAILAQTDAEHFAEGRIALDKYKDCATSLRALQQVSASGQQNPMWVYYMAKANECLGNRRNAIAFYRAYARTNSSPEITEKIGDLQYQLDRARSSLDGRWRYADTDCAPVCGVVFDAKQNGDTIAFTVFSTNSSTGDSVAVGRKWFTFDVAGDRTIKRSWRNDWSDPVQVKAHCPNAPSSAGLSVETLTLSQDGTALDGKIAFPWLSYDTCQIITKETPVRIFIREE
jgi:hypothetical protein